MTVFEVVLVITGCQLVLYLMAGWQEKTLLLSLLVKKLFRAEKDLKLNHTNDLAFVS